MASWEQSRGPNCRGSNSTESGQLLFIVRRGGREREREEEREQETGKRRAVAEKLVARSKIDAARLANVLLGRSSR